MKRLGASAFLICLFIAFAPQTLFSQDSDQVDARFYHIYLRPAIDSPFVDGRVLFRFTVLSDSLNSMHLQLEHHLKVDSITGIENTFSQIPSENLLHISFVRAHLKRNETHEVIVHYHGVPQLANGTKGLRYEFHGNQVPVIASLSTPFLAHYWYPCVDGPGDKADSVWVDICIPDKSYDGHPLMGVSNGLLHHVSQQSGMKTFHWRHGYPIVPYYVLVAVSNYELIRQNYTDPFGNSFPLEYYTFPENRGQTLEGTKQLPAVMDEFSRLYGPYPFAREKYGMTELGFYSGIETQTNVIVNNMGPFDFDTQVHELAHMWFAGMITCKTWHDAWLNEGFATYSEALWKEKAGGRNGYLIAMQNQKVLDESKIYLNDISDPFGIFVSPVYYKASWVLHSLRRLMGEIGFFSAIREYVSHPGFRYGHAEARDFFAIFQKHSTTNLADFFREWIMGDGFPFYALEHSPSFPDKLRLHQLQALDGEYEIFTTPFEISYRTPERVGVSLVCSPRTPVQDIPLGDRQATTPVLMDEMESILCKKVIVSDFEAWKKDGFPYFSISGISETGSVFVDYSGEKTLTGSLEIKSPLLENPYILMKGKISKETGPWAWEGLVTDNETVNQTRVVLLEFKAKSYTLNIPFLWMKEGH